VPRDVFLHLMPRDLFLGRFVPWDVVWDVLCRGTFSVWDVLRVGHFESGTF
jgi:hypothetical protein